MRRLLAFVFLLSVALTAARAQSVHWANSDSGDPSELQLVYENCAPDQDPSLPRMDGLSFTLEGRSSQTQIVNFDVTRSTVLTYRVRATRSVPIQIPPFDVKTNKGTFRVPSFVGGTPPSASDLDLSAHLTPGSTTVWAGEIFPLTYRLDASRRNPSQIVSNLDWKPAPLIAEDWSKPEPTETMVNGEPHSSAIYRTRAYAKDPGTLTLNPASLLVNVQTGSVGMGFFQAPRVEQINVPSDQPTISVRPLPPAPATFTGAVGQFKFTSKVVPAKAAVGDPITWTLELSGNGNWPEIDGLPQRDVSKDFRVVQPKPRRTPAEGKLFDVTLSEDVVLVPTRAGDYTLGPVTFTYFDPKAGDYKTITTPATTITVTAPAAAPMPAATPATPTAENPTPSGPTAGESPAIADLRGKVPAAPGGIPRDPLPGSSTTMPPLTPAPLVALLVAPFGLLLGFWAWLAVRRARLTDPLRPRREAHARLAATLAGMKDEASSRLPPLAPRLLAWQHDAAILWGIPHAAPPAAALTDPAWAQLWTESDRALYGAGGKLPDDWLPRAEAALEAKRPRSFSPLRLFLPRNLFPFVFAAAVALMLALPATSRADETPNSDLRTPISADAAASAYRRGDFPAAEKAWAAAVAAHPTDAVARHNLSLALAQQDRWAESAAHASAALVQDPSNPAIRWEFALACEKAGFAPAPLAELLAGDPVHDVAALVSPTAWQLIGVLATALGAVSTAALIACGYRRRFALAGWLGAIGVVAAVLLVTASVVGFGSYGEAADHRAVIVWRAGTLRSIPTEADNTQKTSPLPAGSLALTGNTLLGWVQLTFANGQTGWVRQEELIPLWR